MSSAFTDAMKTRSAAYLLGSARPWSVLRSALLLVKMAPDSLAMQSMARAPLNFAVRLIEASVRLPRSKVGMSKQEPLTVL